MNTEDRQVEIKVVGKSGQISLGKSYAGKTLRMERRSDGTTLLVPVAMIPESQLWTVEEPDRSRIQRGLEWAAKNPPRESNPEQLARQGRAKRGRR
jgi:hypothetical protein